MYKNSKCNYHGFALTMCILPSGHTELVSKCHGCAVHKIMLEVILWCIGNKVLPQSVGE